MARGKSAVARRTLASAHSADARWAAIAILLLAGCAASTVADAGRDDGGIDATPPDAGAVDTGTDAPPSPVDVGPPDLPICPMLCGGDVDCAPCSDGTVIGCCDPATHYCYRTHATMCPPWTPPVDAGVCDPHCTSDADCRATCPPDFLLWRCDPTTGMCLEGV